jgi:hypothetical protein
MRRRLEHFLKTRWLFEGVLCTVERVDGDNPMSVMKRHTNAVEPRRKVSDCCYANICFMAANNVFRM